MLLLNKKYGEAQLSNPNVVLIAEVKHDIWLVHSAKKIFPPRLEKSKKKSLGHDIQKPVDPESHLIWGVFHRIIPQPHVHFLQLRCDILLSFSSVSNGITKTNHHY